MKGCCFTGYRPEKMPFLLNNGQAEYNEFYNKLKAAIVDAVADGFDTFYNGGAVGFDIIAAEIVIELKKEYDIKLYLALPFPEQADRYRGEWLARYEKIVAACDGKTYACESYFPAGYQMRNEYMVDNSERVITYFNGQKGGTANTIRYALRKGKNIVNTCDYII